MTLVHLGWVDLGVAAALVVLLAALATWSRLEVSRPLLISAARMVIQLALVGLVLETLFAYAALYWVSLMALVMLLLAGREVVARQRRRLAGWWSFGISTGAMFISSFAVTVFALTALVQAVPWYEPRYAIPLLGMLLGNTMNGVALSQDRLIEGAWQQRDIIEARLMLGQGWQEAVGSVSRESMRSGMIPMINGMAAAGVVSLPGMMTGQILAGSPPAEAVKYQILIFLLITVGSGFGTLLANRLVARRLFDERERLRVDRLVEMQSR
ncbi:MAG: iron export ABC transporter permease subunit FetB [Nitrococcus mobilis]|nr:iron export ABC transporter permease subunit FetB [Nitrococcus mobilis]